MAILLVLAIGTAGPRPDLLAGGEVNRGDTDPPAGPIGDPRDGFLERAAGPPLP